MLKRTNDFRCMYKSHPRYYTSTLLSYNNFRQSSKYTNIGNTNQKETKSVASGFLSLIRLCLIHFQE